MPSLKFRNTSTSDLASELHKRTSVKRFEFVTLSNPLEIKNHSIQRRIRRHAGQSTSKPGSQRRRAKSFTFDVPVSLEQTSSHASSDEQESEESEEPKNQSEMDYYPEMHSSISGPLRYMQALGGSLGVQSKVNFPVEYDPHNSLLVDFLIHDAKTNYTPMCRVCILIAMDDRTAWQLMLAGAAEMLYDGNNQGGVSPDALRRYTTCLRDLQTRLNDPRDRVSDGMVSAILTFACQEARKGNLQSWKTHMRGLKKLIDSRGGVETFTGPSTKWLGLSVIWVDVNGSLVMDDTTLFEPPSCFREESSNFSLPHSIGDRLFSDSASEELFDVKDALDSIAKMSVAINNQGGAQSIDDEVECVRYVVPAAHEVLSLSRNLKSFSMIDTVDEIQFLREVIRTSLLVFLLFAKESLCPGPLGGPDQGLRLSELLKTRQINWPASLQPLRLWIHALLVLKRPQIIESWQLNDIALTMRNLGISSWQEVYHMLKSIAWLDSMETRDLQMIFEEN